VTVLILDPFKLEYCQHLGDLEEHGRLGQPYTRTDTTAIPEGGLRLGLFVIQEAEGIINVWIGINFGVTVNCPRMC